MKRKSKLTIFDSEIELRRHLEGSCRTRSISGALSSDPDVVVSNFNDLYGLSPRLSTVLVRRALRYIADECVSAFATRPTLVGPLNKSVIGLRLLPCALVWRTNQL